MYLTETFPCVLVAVAHLFCLQQSVGVTTSSLKSPSHLTRDATRVPLAAGGAIQLSVQTGTRSHLLFCLRVLHVETSSRFNGHNLKSTNASIITNTDTNPNINQGLYHVVLVYKSEQNANCTPDILKKLKICKGFALNRTLTHIHI